MDRPLSVPGAALVPELLLQAPPVDGLDEAFGAAGVLFGALLPQSEDGVLPDLAGLGELWVELLPQPEDELLLGWDGAGAVEGVDELLQPELLPLEDDDDDEDLPPLEKDDLLLLAWAGWPPRTRTRARSRKTMCRTLGGMPGPP
ncbi:hypothetical protein NY78_0381 [Desulfovibrio sp. TomC]|nr:hypothetical protein NY78_0381 [Desulfovibrio sp. TomC]